MKLNNRGFMLAEVVVVSVVIATVLVTLYVALNRLTSAFETRNTYYDVNTAYLAAEVNNILVEDGSINDLILAKDIKDLSSDMSDILELYSGNKKVYFSPYSNYIVEIKNESDNQTFKDYIDYLNDNFNYNGEYSYVIIAEMCVSDRTDCHYYTLRVR